IPDSTKIALNLATENQLKMFDNNGVKNVLTKREQFITPNAAEGLKVYGTADFPGLVPNQYRKGKYVILTFTSKNILQQVFLVWHATDDYADQIMERVLNSVELKKTE